MTVTLEVVDGKPVVVITRGSTVIRMEIKESKDEEEGVDLIVGDDYEFFRSRPDLNVVSIYPE